MDHANLLGSTEERGERILGAASAVRKTLQSLDLRDILDRYESNHFFLDALFPRWIRRKSA